MPQRINLVYEYKDDFSWIRIEDHLPERHRYLNFEDSVQGALDLDLPQQPVFEYIGLMHQAFDLFAAQAPKVLIGGLGGGGLLHALKDARPQARTLTVEASSQIYELCKQHFHLPPREKVQIGDLRRRLEDRKMKDFDAILVDCYTAVSIPPQLTTRAFAQLTYDKLNPGGLMIANLWDKGCNELCGDQVRTILDVYGSLALVECLNEQNLVVVGRKEVQAPFPELMYLHERAYRVDVVHRHTAEGRPPWMEGSGIIEDHNLSDFFDGLGLVI